LKTVCDSGQIQAWPDRDVALAYPLSGNSANVIINGINTGGKKAGCCRTIALYRSKWRTT